MKQSVRIGTDNRLENYGKMFGKLYKDEQLDDVTLCCKDGSLRAHRLILATCSPYFYKIFVEKCDRGTVPLIFLHGVAFGTLKNLMVLLYDGTVDVAPEELAALYTLAGELQITGVSSTLLQEPSVQNQHQDGATSVQDAVTTKRDTRFKGKKRVAVDYDNDSNGHEVEQVAESCNENQADELPKKCLPKGEPAAKAVVSAWAKKLRKYNCRFCPSSFKRPSHLNRHELIHTGEKPYGCDQCDKAFSRPDKLKNHKLKFHPDEDTDEEEEADMRNFETPLPFTISHVRSEATSPEIPSPPRKRPRGRPRKRPITVDPTPPAPKLKRGRGRPRSKPLEAELSNYDYESLPFGDSNYFTMPELQDPVVMEPLIQIDTATKTGPFDNDDVPSLTDQEQESALELVKNEMELGIEEEMRLKELESKIVKIGECTISVTKK